MNCSEIQFLMPLYLSSELEATRLADFELHLQQCSACTRDMEYARHCDDLLRDAFCGQSLETEQLRARVWNQIRKTKRRRFLFGRSIYTLPIAAALLLAITVGIYITFSSQTVYAAAQDDHYIEVVQHEPRPWHETPEEIREFVTQEIGEADFLDRLTPAGYQLKGALHCYLLDQAYVHLVYQNDVREISIYVRHRGAELPGKAAEVVNGCALHAAAVNQFEIAGFQSQKYTVLVVSDLSRAENLQIARRAAVRLP